MDRKTAKSFSVVFVLVSGLLLGMKNVCLVSCRIHYGFRFGFGWWFVVGNEKNVFGFVPNTLWFSFLVLVTGFLRFVLQIKNIVFYRPFYSSFYIWWENHAIFYYLQKSSPDPRGVQIVGNSRKKVEK